MSDGLKPKDEVLKEVFDHVRKEGRVPWVNEEDGYEGHITVDEICLHGKSWVSQYVIKEEESGLWEWESNGESDEICIDCDPYCDCGHHHHDRLCPICQTPWPKLPEERLIAAWKNDEDLVLGTNCPKCGHSWVLSREEMQKLQPEVLAEMEAQEKAEEETWKPAQRRPMRNGRPIGRNSECPCGSGKKYKRCCEGKR